MEPGPLPCFTKLAREVLTSGHTVGDLVQVVCQTSFNKLHMVSCVKRCGLGGHTQLHIASDCSCGGSRRYGPARGCAKGGDLMNRIANCALAGFALLAAWNRFQEAFRDL